MGIWKNLRAGAAFIREYQQDAMGTLPRWARVVRVGRRVFGMVRAWAICRYFRGRSAAYLVGVLPEDERAICRKQIYVVPLNTTSDERIRSGGVQPFSHTPPELGILLFSDA
jgi:hypothetical protein